MSGKKGAKLPPGVEMKIDADGSKRYSGKGGGILYGLADGRWMVILPPDSVPAGKEREDISLLFELWEQGPEVEEPIGESVVKAKSGCAEIMFRALLRKDAQFFRTLGEKIQPTPAKAAQARGKREWKGKTDDEVLDCITEAALAVGRLPSLKEILTIYRKGKGNASKPPSDLKRKLKRRGFEWMGSL